jgi:hypothetical protein
MRQRTGEDGASVQESDAPTPEREERRRRLARLIQAGIAIVVVGAAFIGVLPRISDLDRVWTIVRSLSWTEMLILIALSAWNVVTYWPMLVAAMPGLTLGQAAVVCQSSTSVAMTLPGGGAIAVGVSYAMYTSWGFSPASIALSTLLTGVVNMSFKFLLPVASLAALALNGESDTELLSTAVAGVVVVLATSAILAGMLRRERFAHRIGVLVGAVASFLLRLVRRPAVGEWGDAALRFRTNLIQILRDRGLLLATAEVVSQLSLFLVLLASLRFVGVPDSRVSWDGHPHHPGERGDRGARLHRGTGSGGRASGRSGGGGPGLPAPNVLPSNPSWGVHLCRVAPASQLASPSASCASGTRDARRWRDR